MNVNSLILFFTHIESYQASAPVQQVSTTDKPKSLSCITAICKTIGAHTSTKLLKVLFDSVLTKTMINLSALPYWFQCILNLPPLSSKPLTGRLYQIKLLNYQNLHSLTSIATSLLIIRLLICLTKLLVQYHLWCQFPLQIWVHPQV